MAFHKVSERKLLTLTSADSFVKNNNVYEFQISKNPIQILWFFNYNRHILVILWVRVFVSQGWIQAEVAVNTL